MSKEALTKVREAEAKANAIRDKANADAQAMLEANEKQCAAQAEQQINDANAEWKEQLSTVEQKAKHLIDLSRDGASEDAETIRKQAEEKMPDAVKVIIREIYRVCQ